MQTLVNLLGLVMGSAYEQYQVEVCVTAADTELIPEATSNDGTIAKRVDITVYLPNGSTHCFYLVSHQLLKRVALH